MHTTLEPAARTLPRHADLLRAVLTVNAATSTPGGAVALVAGGSVADLLGTDHVGLVRITGAGLMLFGLAVLALTRSTAATRARLAPIVSVVDVAWVIATGFAVAGDWFSVRGDVVMSAVALVVLDLAIAQIWFARRSSR